jgi:hypothetical protein
MDRNQRQRATLFLIMALLALLTFGKAFSYFYTIYQVRQALASGVYPTPVEAVRHFIENNYIGIKSYEILSARPNEDNGKNPHVWYAIAEVHAENYADGTQVRHNGCDAPGVFVMQIKEGWFLVGEGLFTGSFGRWLVDYSLAGEGQVQPAIDTFHGHSYRMCQPD